MQLVSTADLPGEMEKVPFEELAVTVAPPQPARRETLPTSSTGAIRDTRLRAWLPSGRKRESDCPAVFCGIFGKSHLAISTLDIALVPTGSLPLVSVFYRNGGESKKLVLHQRPALL